MKYTYAINSITQKKQVLFQNILDDESIQDPSLFDFCVFFVPYCENSAQIRLSAKKYRAHYGVDKFCLIDVDETYKTHKRLGLGLSEVAATDELVKDFCRFYEVELV